VLEHRYQVRRVQPRVRFIRRFDNDQTAREICVVYEYSINHHEIAIPKTPIVYVVIITYVCLHLEED
jgi:hypothetical protein